MKTEQLLRAVEANMQREADDIPPPKPFAARVIESAVLAAYALAIAAVPFVFFGCGWSSLAAAVWVCVSFPAVWIASRIAARVVARDHRR